MKEKRIIRLTESELKGYIAECVRSALMTEAFGDESTLLQIIAQTIVSGGEIVVNDGHNSEMFELGNDSAVNVEFDAIFNGYYHDGDGMGPNMSEFVGENEFEITSLTYYDENGEEHELQDNGAVLQALEKVVKIEAHQEDYNENDFFEDDWDY